MPDAGTGAPSPPHAAPAAADLVRSATRVGIGAVLGIGGWAARVVRQADNPEPLALGPGAPVGEADLLAPDPVPLGPIASTSPAAPGHPVAATAHRSPAADVVEPVPPRPGPRHLAIGLVFAAQDGAFGVLDAAGRATARVAPTAQWLWHAPGLGPVRERVQARTDALVARGVEEELRSRRASTQALDVVIDDVSDSPMVVGVVDQVVGEIIGPVLDTVLPLVFDRLQHSQTDSAALIGLVNDIVDRVLEPILDDAIPTVLGRLNEDPSTVRDLVRDQSTSIAVEVADSVRTRTVTLDDRVEKIAWKFRPRIRKPPRADR